jgi:hypothetical protein
MSTRDNTKVVQAHILIDLNKSFEKKLIDDGKTKQQFIEEAIREYTSQK